MVDFVVRVESEVPNWSFPRRSDLSTMILDPKVECHGSQVVEHNKELAITLFAVQAFHQHWERREIQ